MLAASAVRPRKRGRIWSLGVLASWSAKLARNWTFSGAMDFSRGSFCQSLFIGHTSFLCDVGLGLCKLLKSLEHESGLFQAGLLVRGKEIFYLLYGGRHGPKGWGLGRRLDGLAGFCGGVRTGGDDRVSRGQVGKWLGRGIVWHGGVDGALVRNDMGRGRIVGHGAVRGLGGDDVRVLSAHAGACKEIAEHVDQILLLGIAVGPYGFHDLQGRTFLAVAWGADAHGPYLLLPKQGYGPLQFPQLYKEGEETLSGYIYIGDGGFYHLKMMVADKIVKIS